MGNLEGAEIHEENDEREAGSSRATTQTRETPVVLDSEAQAHSRGLGQDEQIKEHPPRDGAFPVDDSHRRPPEVRMIRDFDDSANALWTLYAAVYGKEAKSHDEAGIQNLKDDMDGVLIFVRVYPTARLWVSLMRSHSPIGRIVFRYSHFVFDPH